jgi:dsDNA-binding SOS-regulon protein
VEIQNRQRTVDFVNHSTSSSTHSPEADRTELAEELGSMNHRYQAVASNVSEQLKQLDVLQMQWKEYDEQVDELALWFADQDAKLGNMMQLHRPAAIQQAVKDCQVRQIEQYDELILFCSSDFYKDWSFVDLFSW